MQNQNYSSQTMMSRPSPSRSGSEVANSIVTRALVRAANPTDMWGVAPWGFPTLDSITGGIQAGTTTFLGARPAVGKSAWAAQVAVSVANYFQAQGENKYVKLILFEMSAEAFYERMASALSGVSQRKIKRGRATPDEFMLYVQAAESLEKLPIQFLDQQSSFSGVEKFLLDKQHTTGFWVLDHIKLFRDVAQNANQTGAIVNAANFCLEMSHAIAPSLIIGHMNRDTMKNKDGRPTLENYAGSDQIGANADLALALYREWMTLDIPQEQKSDPQPAELLVLKNREGGLRNIPLVYAPRLTKFEEVPGMVEDDE